MDALSLIQEFQTKMSFDIICYYAIEELKEMVQDVSNQDEL